MYLTSDLRDMLGDFGKNHLILFSEFVSLKFSLYASAQNTICRLLLYYQSPSACFLHSYINFIQGRFPTTSLELVSSPWVKENWCRTGDPQMWDHCSTSSQPWWYLLPSPEGLPHNFYLYKQELTANPLNTQPDYATHWPFLQVTTGWLISISAGKQTPPSLNVTTLHSPWVSPGKTFGLYEKAGNA